jgi:hypothetical protein
VGPSQLEKARRFYLLMVEALTARDAATPLDEEGALWALVALDGNEKPEQVIVAFREPAEADMYGNLADDIDDHRVVPLSFLPATPRELPERGGPT